MGRFASIVKGRRKLDAVSSQRKKLHVFFVWLPFLNPHELLHRVFFPFTIVFCVPIG